MSAKRKSTSPKDSSANLGFEAKLWLAADKLRNHMDAAEPNGARQPAAGSPKGQRGGDHQFYTPSCVVRLLVEILAPYNGRIYDPACGSGGNPRHSESRSEAETASRRLPAGQAQRGNFVKSHGGQLSDISIYSASLAV